VTDLLLIRHGQADHNLVGYWVGWGPSPLTDDGHRQAEALARRLASWSPAITHLYASPLRRARQTAEPIARQLGLQVLTHDGLREINFGVVDGLTMETFRQTMPELFARWRDRGDLSFKYPGGEQRQAFFRRVGQTLDEIVDRHPGQRIAVVAHGGTIRGGLAWLFPDTMRDWWAYDLNNGSLTHVRVGGKDKSLMALNDCEHLDRGCFDER
jgi:broad specificity phosphatase PhoE